MLHGVSLGDIGVIFTAAIIGSSLGKRARPLTIIVAAIAVSVVGGFIMLHV